MTRKTETIKIFSNEEMRTRGLPTATIQVSNSRNSIELYMTECVNYIDKHGELKDRTKHQYINIPADGIDKLKEIIAAYEAAASDDIEDEPESDDIAATDAALGSVYHRGGL